MKTNKVKPLPKDKQAAFVSSSLYECFDLNEREEDELTKFFLGGGTIDTWCSVCRRLSVFSIKSQLSYGEEKTLPHSGLINIEGVCSRGGTERYSGCNSVVAFIFQKNGDKIIKVGQYPAKAEAEFAALDEAFEKELSNPLRKELGRAIGLNSHGIGIGSFVYLRRIFEALVEEAHIEAQKDTNWDSSRYNHLRMLEKIQALKDHLPSRLVQTSHLYTISTLGIHELTEAQCLKNFQLMKSAIELILKERHEIRKYNEIAKQVQVQVDECKQERSKKSN